MATNRPLNINQFIREVDRAIAKLPVVMLDALESVALTAKSDIQERIVETGKSHSGSPLPPYTPAYLQFKQDVGRYRGHVDISLGNYSINKRIAAVERRKRAKKRKTRTREQIDELKKVRRAKAIPAGSTLWRNINIVEKVGQGGILRVTVAPRDEQNKKKLDGLSKKRGDLLTPSRKEEKKIVDGMETAYVNAMKSIGQ